MIAAVLIALLQATAAPEAAAPDAAPAAQEAPAPAPGTMSCEPWDRGTRTRMCTTAEGEVLRCRRERVLGSRFPETICMTYRQDQQVDEDTRRYLNRQQRLWDNQSAG